MTLGKNSAKKQAKQRSSENEREHDQADCRVTHVVFLKSGIDRKWRVLDLLLSAAKGLNVPENLNHGALSGLDIVSAGWCYRNVTRH
jgi:hypothetical protein